jgi:mitogen-activated protein kinase 1/3
MLIFNPAKRISVREALAHPYFDGVREQYTFGEAESTPAFEFSFEYERELNAEDYKRLIIEEARSFKQEYLYSMVWERVEPYALII